MRQHLKISLPILLTVLIIGFWALSWDGTSEDPTYNSTSLFDINPLAEDVSLKVLGESSFEVMLDSTTTEEGGTLRTSDSGRAVVTSPNESITVVDSNTEMVLALAAPEGSRIRLQAGNLWSRVEKTLEQGEFYEIETEEVLAAVRGTSFGTERYGTTTIITIVEGEVTLFYKNDRGGVSENRKDIVRSGSKVLISRDRQPVIRDINPEDRMDEWFIFNNPRVNEEPVEDRRIDVIDQAEPSPPTSAETAIDVPAAGVKLVIYRVSPDNITIGETEDVVIWGEGFTDIQIVYVGEEQIGEFFVLRDDAIQFRASEILDDGLLDIRVVNQNGKSAVLTEALTINDALPQNTPQDDPYRDPQYNY